MEKHSVSGSRI